MKLYQHLVVYQRHIVIFLFLGFLATFCTQKNASRWYDAIPFDVPAVVTFQQNTTIKQVVSKSFVPLIDDLSSSAIPLIEDLGQFESDRISIRALLLTTGSTNDLQPVWIAHAPVDALNQLSQQYRKQFIQNFYEFKGHHIEKLFLGGRVIYATQQQDILIFSESSFGLEESLRALLGIKPSLESENNLYSQPGFIVNTGHLDDYVKQAIKVAYYPQLTGLFEGTGPALLNTPELSTTDTTLKYRFVGDIPLNPDSSSVLTSAISQKNRPISLDRYISDNAASFAILRLEPTALPVDSIKKPSRLDSLLLADRDLYNNFRKLMEDEMAFVTFDESGFLSEGEGLYLRRLNDFQAFYDLLNQLELDGFVEPEDGTFYVKSRILAHLIGSPLCNLGEFYLTNAYNAAVIAQRKGRAGSVKADRSRRQVIYYQDDYLSIRNSFPDSISSLLYANSEPALDYLQPYLAPNNQLSTLLNEFDYFVAAAQRKHQPERLHIDIQMRTYNQNDNPYEEQWAFPLNGDTLTSKPIMVDIGGSSRSEVIFSTQNGSLYALATDGTVVLQTSTGLDNPIGSPIVYDWYGNNQDAIIQAAGNKLYAWSDVGELLPQFPIPLSEDITAPAVIADVTRDGIPEAVIATSDRKIHILDGRGNDIDGWPQSVNAPITEAPLFKKLEDEWALIAFSGNTLHAWQPDGSIRPGFPVFFNATLEGAPLLYDDHILGNAADGHLYSVGRTPLFDDSLNVLTSANATDGAPGSLQKEAVYIANSALQGTPSYNSFSVLSEEDSTVVQKPMFITMSKSGSVFLLSEKGKLQFVKNMGQPANQQFSPFIADLGNNGRKDILALASFGRLYGWEVYSGNRNLMLPTTAMTYPVITDFEGDELLELVAQTDDGLQVWTLSNQ